MTALAKPFTPGTPEAEAAGRALGFKGHAVTLEDGRVVCSWSAEWMDECKRRHAEALRMLDTFAGVEVRRMHLEKVEAERGLLARQRLEASLLELWNGRRRRRAEEAAREEKAAAAAAAEGADA